MTWEWVVGILGAIVLIGNAGAVVYRWISPAMKMKETVKRHEDEIAEIHKHEKNDLESIAELRRLQRLELKAMINILNHMIDGNNVERMKETRDEIHDLLAGDIN